MKIIQERFKEMLLSTKREGMENVTADEIMAIRWHMTAWDLPFQSPEMKGNLNAARERCPLMALIQAADGLAANMLER